MVEVEKIHRQKDIQHEIEGLEHRYETIEKLHQKVMNEKCGDPLAVDDYVVWKALKSPDVVLTEKIAVDSPKIFADLSPKRLEILEYVRMHNVKSIKDLAEELDRNYKNVYDDLKSLEKWGLVSLPRKGKDKKPVSHVESLKVTFHR